MSKAVRNRLISFLSTLVIVPFITYFVILFARGYRPDVTTKKLEPTGILAATSHPESAQLIINGEVKTATNNSLNLTPGDYVVQIKKEGFQTWSKKIIIEKEIVSRANAYLFANIPTLKAITTSGAKNIYLSPDHSKIVFMTGANLYLLDISDSPLGIVTREPQILTIAIPKLTNLHWSPDSRQLLIQSSASAQLVDINSSKVTESSIGLPALLSDWEKKKSDSYLRQYNSLPIYLQDFLATTSAQISWNNSDKKILYTATASAVMPDRFKVPLPGSNSQPQQRTLSPNQTYTYDIEEDRNFVIGSNLENWKWYPTGNHIYRLDGNNFIIKEYDNTNETVRFVGIVFEKFAIPYPSGKQLLVLTNLNGPSSALPNLYSVNLK